MDTKKVEEIINVVSKNWKDDNFKITFTCQDLTISIPHEQFEIMVRKEKVLRFNGYKEVLKRLKLLKEICKNYFDFSKELIPQIKKDDYFLHICQTKKRQNFKL